MKLKKTLAVTFALTLTAAPVFAQQTAEAGSQASSGSNAIVEGAGKVFGGASVGAAYCVDSVGAGPFAAALTLRACVANDIAESAGRLATLSREEIAAVQRAALADIGYELRTIQPAAPADPAAPVATAAKQQLSVQGDWGELSPAQRTAVSSCELLWNGKQIESCVGRY